MSEKDLFVEFTAITPKERLDNIRKELKAGAEEHLLWKRLDNMNLLPYYHAGDLEFISESESKRGALLNEWQIVEDIEVAEKGENIANLKGLEALNNGATALCFKGHINDLDSLLQNIWIENIAIYFKPENNYADVLKSFIDLVDKRKLNPAEITGGVLYDPIGALVLNGNWEISEEKDLNETAHLIEKKPTDLENFSIINISGDHYHNAGASPVQEIAFTLAHAHEYVVELLNHKTELTRAIRSFRFTFAVGTDYFIEIAKLRAFRLLWSRIIEEYGMTDHSPYDINIHCNTSRWNLATQDTYTNLLRSTTEAMSAIIGGAGSITILPHDLAVSQPNNFSKRLARNIQLILRDESHLNYVSDPAGGSYYIETVTEQMAEKAWKLFQKVEEKEGFLIAFREKFIQNEIAEMAKVKQEAFSNQELVFVGVNKYKNKENLETVREISARHVNEVEDNGKLYQPIKLFSITSLSKQEEV